MIHNIEEYADFLKHLHSLSHSHLASPMSLEDLQDQCKYVDEELIFNRVKKITYLIKQNDLILNLTPENRL